MSKIEQGCVAVVFGSCVPVNNGKSVHVGRFIGRLTFINLTGELCVTVDDDMWEVDVPMVSVEEGTGKKATVMCQSERRLMRIDGYKAETGIRQLAES